MYNRKWKADKVGVECVCCYGDGSVVLTAGRSIKMWSLESCTLIKVNCTIIIEIVKIM